MITERKIIDKIEIIENNSIQIREANIIEKNGEEISRVFHRYVKHPIDDISNEDEKVKAIANVIWTPEVINAYKEFLAKVTDLKAENDELRSILTSNNLQ